MSSAPAIDRILDLPTRASARSPQCAGGGVLEQDSTLTEALSDRVRCTEILALARRLALGDRGLDLRVREAGALLPPAPRRLEERGRLLGEEPERGART